MGAQWDRAGGRARVPRIADLVAPFMMRQSHLFISSFRILLMPVAWAHAYWIDRNSWCTLLLSSGFVFCLTRLVALSCIPTLAFDHPHPSQIPPAPPKIPIKCFTYPRKRS